MRGGTLASALTLVLMLAHGPGYAQVPASWAADPAFYAAWQRADGLVAAGTAGRSWLWGPEPFAVANELWAQSVTGTRLVQYFDKARMEVNDPQAEPASPFYVTNGLLVTEMVTGRIQTGENTFQPHP